MSIKFSSRNWLTSSEWWDANCISCFFKGFNSKHSAAAFLIFHLNSMNHRKTICCQTRKPFINNRLLGIINLFCSVNRIWKTKRKHSGQAREIDCVLSNNFVAVFSFKFLASTGLRVVFPEVFLLREESKMLICRFAFWSMNYWSMEVEEAPEQAIISRKASKS